MYSTLKLGALFPAMVSGKVTSKMRLSERRQNTTDLSERQLVKYHLVHQANTSGMLRPARLQNVAEPALIAQRTRCLIKSNYSTSHQIIRNLMD